MQIPQSALMQTQMVQPTARLDYLVQPIVPRLPACIARYYTKQHEIKSNARENDTNKRYDGQQMYEAAASVTQYTVLQQTFFISRNEHTIK